MHCVYAYLKSHKREWQKTDGSLVLTEAKNKILLITIL